MPHQKHHGSETSLKIEHNLFFQKQINTTVKRDFEFHLLLLKRTLWGKGVQEQGGWPKKTCCSWKLTQGTTRTPSRLSFFLETLDQTLAISRSGTRVSSRIAPTGNSHRQPSSRSTASASQVGTRGTSATTSSGPLTRMATATSTSESFFLQLTSLQVEQQRRSWAGHSGKNTSYWHRIIELISIWTWKPCLAWVY